MAPQYPSSASQTHISGKLMKETLKRTHTEAIDSDASDDSEPKTYTHTQSPPCLCARRSSGPYAELDERHDFEIDVPDILEDYLSLDGSAAPSSLVLDKWEGVWESVLQMTYNGMEIAVDTSVMLKNGTFMRITEIQHEKTHKDTVLRGYKLIRTACLPAILDNGEDEMELLLNYTQLQGSKLTVLEQSLVDVPICRVKQAVPIRICNYEKSSDTPKDTYYCRWKLTRYYQDIPGKKRRGVEVAIERIRASEADPHFCTPDDMLRCNWRGRVSEGPSLGSSYTALDGFCCGGGWSRGADMAGGVKVIRSFDIDENACRTYRANFPLAKCLQADVFQYCLPQNLPDKLKQMATTPEHVDIAHYSTPCQFFSPAHTREGPNDDKNVAASFCLGHLLDKDRPRIVTFENTSGLERRHFKYLKAIFGQITSKGYSLRFATLKLANYGLPQDRRRLIMLAACPGELLPTFPPATHSENGSIPGTLDWTRPADVIKHIPSDGWPNHFPSRMEKMALPTKVKRLLPTLTCTNTAQEVHPDGRRYTICEYQLLQGFPLHHRFAMGLKPTTIRAQIGNAFPPSFVKQLVRHIRKQLQKSDGLPETWDDDDQFTSLKEIREREINQFYEDHDTLPEGTRANVSFMEPDDYCDDDEQEGEDNSTRHSAIFKTLNSRLEYDKPKRSERFGDLDPLASYKRLCRTSDQTSTRSTLYSLCPEEPTYGKMRRMSLPRVSPDYNSILREETTTYSTVTSSVSTSFWNTSSSDPTLPWRRAVSIRPRKPDQSYLTERPSSRASSGTSKSSSSSDSEPKYGDSKTHIIICDGMGTEDDPVEID